MKSVKNLEMINHVSPMVAIDAFEAKKKHSVTVFFPVTPFVSNDTLRTLYEHPNKI